MCTYVCTYIHILCSMQCVRAHHAAACAVYMYVCVRVGACMYTHV